jgi:4-hydroxybenzoate polyprenyltransferase
MGRARALLLSTHLGPSIVTTLAATLLGVAVGYPAPRVALLAGAFLAGQFSIGWSNDWIDAARDVVAGRRDKPTVQGAVSPRALRTSAFIAAAVAIVLTALLGPLAAVVHVVAIGFGWAYNAGLKNTPVSVVPFIVSFGLLPAIVTLGGEPTRFAAPWVLAVGAMLGIAAHFTNVLPDLETDRDTGVRGLPHMLGGTVSGIVAFCCVAGAAATIAFAGGSPASPANIAGLGVGVAIGVVGVVLVLASRRSRLLMRLVMAGAIIDVAMLIANGQSLGI